MVAILNRQGFTHADIRNVMHKYRIIGESEKLEMSLWRALRVAETDLPVFINGENGTGKESLARIIHDYSLRRHGPFVAVNCGAIPSGTIDSELFGHEKGSFTDAIAKRKGYFEEAEGGTIFLDEIAELPLEAQAKLLRVLGEYSEIKHVGSSKTQMVNIRIIAATNKDLQKMVNDGTFREDLFYRLSTVQISLPPLRERGEDVLILFSKFAADFAMQYKTAPISLDDEAKVYILKYPFPGNIRQLKNLVGSMSVFEINRQIGVKTLGSYLNVNTKAPMRLPHDVSTQHDYKVEIELLYKMIVDLKKSQDEIKSVIAELLHDLHPEKESLIAHKALFSSMNSIPNIEVKNEDGN